MSEPTNSEVKAAMTPFYRNSSKLKITAKEAKRLAKPFPDNQVEILENGSLYIPHILISERLNEVIGIGQWSLIVLEHFIEDENDSLYFEIAMVVRDCHIDTDAGEIDVTLAPELRTSKRKSTYFDALEFAKGKALRAICGKRLSCGSQVWIASYCAKWIEKHAETMPLDTGGQIWRKKGAKVSLDQFSETPVSRHKLRPAADENMRHVMLQILGIQGNENVLKFAIAEKILAEGQTLDDWPLDQVAIGEREVRALALRIQKHFAPVDADGWQNYKIPIGTVTIKGKKLGDLAVEDISSLWELISTSPQVSKKYPAFMEALDKAAIFHNLQKLKSKK